MDLPYPTGKLPHCIRFHLLYYDKEERRIIRSIKQPSAMHCSVSNNRLLLDNLCCWYDISIQYVELCHLESRVVEKIDKKSNVHHG